MALHRDTVSSTSRTDRIRAAVIALLEHYRAELDTDPYIRDVVIRARLLPSRDIRAIEIDRRAGLSQKQARGDKSWPAA